MVFPTRFTRPANPALVGIVWKIVSAFSFTLMLTMVKLLGETLPVGQILFARNFFGLVPVIVVVAWTGGLASALTTGHLGGHAKRAVAGMLAMGLWFSALPRLSFPEATAIVYAAPLIMVALAALLLGERVRIYRWSAVAIGFAGVSVIVVPQVMAGFAPGRQEATVGVFLAMGAACFMALASVFTRELARKERTVTIVVYFLVTGTAVTALTAPTWVMPTAEQALLLLLVGVFGGAGQLMLTQAYQHAEASLIAPFEYTSMIWVVSLGYLVFDEVPAANVIFGAAIVIGSGIFVILRERRLGLQREERKLGTPLRP